MNRKKLYWMKASALQELHASIPANLDRYRKGDFEDLINQDWRQKEITEYDADEISQLSGKSTAELEDSLVLYNNLHDLPANLATSMQIWVPLIHTDLLNFARVRWLNTDDSDDKLIKNIQTHVFRGGVGGYRDDNAAARLWWNGYIGERLTKNLGSDDVEKTLKPLMRTTDTRQAVFERSGLFSESKLGANISRYVAEGKLPDSNSQKVFRQFMVNVNHMSNGRYFGDMSQREIFDFLDLCH